MIKDDVLMNYIQNSETKEVYFVAGYGAEQITVRAAHTKKESHIKRSEFERDYRQGRLHKVSWDGEAWMNIS